MDVVWRWAGLLVALVTIGCPSAPPTERTLTFDGSGVGPAALGVPYSGQLRTNPGSEARWVISAGALPPGLSLAEDGGLRGAPQWIGGSTITVSARIEGREPVTGTVSIDVGPGDAAVFLGFPRDPVLAPGTTVLLGGLWARVAGGGESQAERLIDPGWYLAGPDGVPAGGGGDDQRVGDLTPGVDVDVVLGQWLPSDEVAADPPIDPSGHTNEGSPPSYADGRFVAGADAGRLSVTLWRDDVEPLLTRFSVVPPDWCPAGSHPRGGPSPGVCE